MSLIFFLTALLSACKDDSKNPDDSGSSGTDDTSPSGDDGSDGGDDTSPPDPCESDSITLVLGTGEDTYEEVSEGGEIAMVHGSQGGWHFVTGFVTYRSESIVRFRIAGYDVKTGELVCQSSDPDSPLQVQTVPVDDCRSIYYNVYCYISDPLPDALINEECDTPPESITGRQIRLEIELTDYADQQAADTLIFVAAPDPDDSTECHDEDASSDTGDTGK